MQTETLSNKSWVNLRLAGYTDPLAFTIHADGSLIGFNPHYNVENTEQIEIAVIPPVINGIACTNIKSGVFNTVDPIYSDREIKIVVGPKSLTKIDDYAFAGCNSLKYLLLYNDKPEISNTAFQNVNPALKIFRLANTANWPTQINGIPIIEVENFNSVLRTENPLYFIDVIDNSLHEVRIVNHKLQSGEVQ